MLATLISLATEAGGHGGTSKTPFYVAGAILAGWAVIVSALGILRHESFPSGKGGRTGVMAITVLLVIAVMTTSITTA